MLSELTVITDGWKDGHKNEWRSLRAKKGLVKPSPVGPPPPPAPAWAPHSTPNLRLAKAGQVLFLKFNVTLNNSCLECWTFIQLQPSVRTPTTTAAAAGTTTAAAATAATAYPETGEPR